jgi:hypothetical protein
MCVRGYVGVVGDECPTANPPSPLAMARHGKESPISKWETLNLIIGHSLLAVGY